MGAHDEVGMACRLSVPIRVTLSRPVRIIPLDYGISGSSEVVRRFNGHPFKQRSPAVALNDSSSIGLFSLIFNTLCKWYGTLT
jgi:hypothetical protein